MSAIPNPENIRRAELKNGTVVLVYENHASPAVVVRGHLRAGALFEPPEKQGLASFTAEVVERGTTSRTFQQIAQQTEEVGASVGFAAGIHLVGFSAKGLSEDEKLQMIEKHARAMFETWGTWNEWATNVGREIYAKTTRMRLGWNDYITKVLSHLRDFTGAKYVLKKKGDATLVTELDQSGANIFANRGVGSFRETKGRIAMESDIIGAIYARNMEEYWRIQKRWGMKVARVITERGAEEPYNGVVISPEILKEVVKQVEERFDVKIKIRKDRPVLVTSFNTDKLRPYGKLYEIERHTRALAEAWSRIKEKVPNRR